MRGRRRDTTPTRGDLDALVRTHAPSLRKHVRYVYPLVDADEVVNHVFTIAWQRFDTIPEDAEAVWLRAVVRGVVANYRRGQRRWNALTSRIAQLTPDAPVLPPDNPGQLQLRMVASAIDTLSAADREIIMISALEELSTEDLAEILDLQPSTAKKRLSRARTRLRAALSSAELAIEGGNRE